MNFFSRLLGAAPAGTEAPAVDPTEAKRRLADGATLIDVRETDEWQSGHAPGATHIPLAQLEGRLRELPRDRDVLLVCRSGNRSATAQRLLRSRGLHRSVNVAGGMIAWGRAGLPLDR